MEGGDGVKGTTFVLLREGRSEKLYCCEDFQKVPACPSGKRRL